MKGQMHLIRVPTMRCLTPRPKKQKRAKAAFSSCFLILPLTKKSIVMMPLVITAHLWLGMNDTAYKGVLQLPNRGRFSLNDRDLAPPVFKSFCRSPEFSTGDLN